LLESATPKNKKQIILPIRISKLNIINSNINLFNFVLDNINIENNFVPEFGGRNE